MSQQVGFKQVKEIYPNSQTVDLYQHYLDTGQGFEDERPDGTVDVWTANFGDGWEMDVKLCNAPAADGGCWTEAVLFYNGHEVSHTDPRANILGEWTIEHGVLTFTINVLSK